MGKNAETLSEERDYSFAVHDSCYTLRGMNHFSTLFSLYRVFRWCWRARAAGLLGLLVLGCSGSQAPNSRFDLLDRSTVSIEAFRGKVVLVNFWATSCVTCVAEMPEMMGTYEKFRNRGYEMVAVAMKYDPPSYVVQFAQSRKLPFKVALDTTGEVAKAWGDVAVTPTSFLLDRQGRIVKRYVGTPNFSDLHTLIEKMLPA